MLDNCVGAEIVFFSFPLGQLEKRRRFRDGTAETDGELVSRLRGAQGKKALF